MNKYLKILLSLLLVIVLLSFCACGNNGEQGGEGEGEQGDGESFKNSDEIRNQIKEYFITIKFDDSTTLTYAQNSKANLYLDESGDGFMTVFAEKAYYSITDTTKTKIATINDGSFNESGVTLFDTYLTSYSSYSDGLEKSGTATIAGRTCNKYTYSLLMVGSYSYYVDKTTDICMKMEIVSGGEKTGWEVTELKLNNVNLDKYLNLETEGDGGMEQGEKVTSWPKSKVDSYIKLSVPELTGGSLYTPTYMDYFVMMNVSGVNQSVYDAYVQKLLSSGFTGEEGFYNFTSDLGTISISLSIDAATISLTISSSVY